MKNDNKRTHSKENVLRNGTKTQNQQANSSYNFTVEEPALNESGVEAKKRLLEKAVVRQLFLIDNGQLRKKLLTEFLKFNLLYL